MVFPGTKNINAEQYLDNPAENMGFLLWQTTMDWQRQLNRALGEANLTHTQFAILSALRFLLANSNSVTQKEIAHRSNTDTMMVSKVLRTLEVKGLIIRQEHKTDTRAKSVFLTPKGNKTFEEAFEIATEANRVFFSKLSNLDCFRKGLQEIVEIERILKKPQKTHEHE